MPQNPWTDLAGTTRVLATFARHLCDALLPVAPPRLVASLPELARRAEGVAQALDTTPLPDLTNDRVRHDLRADIGLLINYPELLRRQKNTAYSPRLLNLASLVASTARVALDQLESLIREVAGVAQVITREASPATTARAAPLSASRRGRILVVDDNPLNRDDLQTRLELQGHDVTPAASGREALELLGQHPFDLVLLDVMMPEMDGFEVLGKLKAHSIWRNMPVLMVSALDRMDSVVAGIARGAEDYLTRPLDENEVLLHARIGACLEKKRLRDKEIEYQKKIDDLLHAIFPHEFVGEVTRTGKIAPRRRDKVGVCFIDVVGFTSYCDQQAGRPEEVVHQLQWYVQEFEDTTRHHAVQKIKTIGDALLVVSGLLQPVANPVLELVRYSTDLIRRVRHGPAGWQVRVGIHVGSVVAGTLGESQYSFDLWGSTVNIAARMESVGHPGTITLSEEAWKDVRAVCRGKERDEAVRGIGPMTVYEIVPGTTWEESQLSGTIGTSRADGSRGCN